MEPRSTHDELKDAPTLRVIPKVDPFVVPEGFFDRFPQQVQARIAKPEGIFAKLWRGITEAPPALRVAGLTAVVAIITGAVYFNLPNAPYQAPAIARFTMEPNEIDLDAIDDADLFAMIDDEPEMMTQVGADLSTEEMEAYLESENLPLDLLIEEL